MLPVSFSPRRYCIASMQTMRPVCLADFESAIEFWAGNHTPDQGSGESHLDGRAQHYDSSSGSEDEDEEVNYM